MDRLQRGCLITGLLAGVLLNPVSSNAQYSASYQTNIISGVTSNWSGSYIVGSLGYMPFADVLLIQNGGNFTPSEFGANREFLMGSSNNTAMVTDPGSALFLNEGLVQIGGVGNRLVVSNGAKLVSSSFSSSVLVEGPDNSIVVTGPGSAWSNSVGLFLGHFSPGGSLVIRNGGLVVNSQSASLDIGDMAVSGNNSILVADPGSVWSNGFSIPVEFGYRGNGNSLVISNGGTVFARSFTVGLNATASGNSVQVLGNGSVWNSPGAVTIGYVGSSNSLVIGDGGNVLDGNGYVGRSNSLNNSAVVSGSGSVWSNASTLFVGYSGVGNSLVITNGGQVFDGTGVVGSQLGSSSNYVQVVDGGLWQTGGLTVGGNGSSNSLVIDGGAVLADSLTIGLGSPTCDNLVQLDNGILAVTNFGTGVLDVRNGELILNGGTLQVDTLVITNSCASFVHTGGTLIAGSVVLDPNSFRITSVVQQGNDLLVTWLMGPGRTNTLQATTGGPGGSYATNGFTDIFLVTNNTTVGTVTNYLDIGAATNTPSRFYRARLVP